MTSLLISFVNTLDQNNHPINGTAQWSKYNMSMPTNVVFDVNVMQFMRDETDDYRSEAISYWADLSTNEYPK